MAQVIFGPMFSGKTTELLRRMKRFTIAKVGKCMHKEIFELVIGAILASVNGLI